jgi:hypothetical protein
VVVLVHQHAPSTHEHGAAHWVSPDLAHLLSPLLGHLLHAPLLVYVLLRVCCPGALLLQHSSSRTFLARVLFLLLLGASLADVAVLAWRLRDHALPGEWVFALLAGWYLAADGVHCYATFACFCTAPPSRSSSYVETTVTATSNGDDILLRLASAPRALSFPPAPPISNGGTTGGSSKQKKHAR